MDRTQLARLQSSNRKPNWASTTPQNPSPLKEEEKGRRKGGEGDGAYPMRGGQSTGGCCLSASCFRPLADERSSSSRYYMQTYSIILGRNSKKSTVVVDLSSLGDGMNISCHHARIFYDFTRRRFALEVLNKNGCLVEDVLHLPGNPPVKLDSQDLLQIGDGLERR
ncbi:hypothetical protein Tsubulata_016852 [Turnera subulata]|uniref:FHA domain-containing protein n=1 Tax=Turnera subulata TaxID=218843 RepID=A0A9Q0JF86_9ROSI|nr:hypothetical protein Tsubulata_016852 [Turnera subulata]